MVAAPFFRRDARHYFNGILVTNVVEVEHCIHSAFTSILACPCVLECASLVCLGRVPRFGSTSSLVDWDVWVCSIVCRESIKSEVLARDFGDAAGDDGGHAAASRDGHREDATSGAAWRLGSIQVIIARMKSRIRYCFHNFLFASGAENHAQS